MTHSHLWAVPRFPTLLTLISIFRESRHCFSRTLVFTVTVLRRGMANGVVYTEFLSKRVSEVGRGVFSPLTVWSADRPCVTWLPPLISSPGQDGQVDWVQCEGQVTVKSECSSPSALPTTPSPVKWGRSAAAQLSGWSGMPARCRRVAGLQPIRFGPKGGQKYPKWDQDNRKVCIYWPDHRTRPDPLWRGKGEGECWRGHLYGGVTKNNRE